MNSHSKGSIFSFGSACLALGILTFFLAASSQAAQEPPLSLAELVDLALSHSPQVKQAQANLAAAQGRLMQTNSGFWPQVTGQASWTKYRSEFSSSSTPDGQQALAGLSLTQSLLDLSLWSQNRVSRLEELSYKALVRAVENQVAAEVRAAYLELMAARRLLEVYREQEKETAAALERANKLLQNGLSSPLEVARTRLDLAQAQRRVIEGRTAALRLMARLAAVVALPHIYGLPLAPWDTNPQSGLQQAVKMGEQGLVARALANRAEMQRLDFLAKAAEEAVEAAQAGNWPTLSIQAGLGQAGKSDLDSQYHSYGLALEIPIFTGFRLWGSVAERRGLALAARQDLNMQSLSVRMQTQQAWQGLLQSQDVVAVSQSQLESARENFRIVNGRFENGLASTLELSEARYQLFNAQAESARADFGIFQALSEVDRVLGGGLFAGLTAMPSLKK